MKKTKKLKTYVITVSKNFIGKHPRSGEPTDFKNKIVSGEKIHTCRGNYIFWKKRIDKVNAGEAILSLRQWSARPYNSKQEEIFQLTKAGIQQITTTGYGQSVAVVEFDTDGTEIDFEYRFLTDYKIKKLAKNDGLSVEDFREWFKEPVINGCIIHFTNLKY